MSKEATCRYVKQSTPAIALVMLMLCFSVFAWGLHYKLSLYHTPSSVSTHEPAAKLLNSRDSRDDAAQAPVQADRQAAPVLLLTMLLLLTLPASTSGMSALPMRAVRRSFAVAVSGPLFRRPPPNSSTAA